MKPWFAFFLRKPPKENETNIHQDVLCYFTWPPEGRITPCFTSLASVVWVHWKASLVLDSFYFSFPGTERKYEHHEYALHSSEYSRFSHGLSPVLRLTLHTYPHFSDEKTEDQGRLSHFSKLAQVEMQIYCQNRMGAVANIQEKKVNSHRRLNPPLLTDASLVLVSSDADFATFWMMGAMLVGP